MAATRLGPDRLRWRDGEPHSRELIRNVVSYCFGLEAKELQLEAISLVLYGDLIVIAKTGFGKSLLYQALPLMWFPSKIALIVMPLMALQDEQCAKLCTVKGCNPLVLNGLNNSAEVRHSIRDGIYTHIFTSPEIAISQVFMDDVLGHTQFSARLCVFAIDECHLTTEWADFRQDYARLGILRTRLPHNLPWLAVSAILHPAALQRMKEVCYFHEQTSIMRTPLDRPEIFMQASELKESMKSMLDLQYILPVSFTSPYDIPKTVIYMDSVKQVKECCHTIRGWMHQFNYPESATRLVWPYYADMAELDKARIQGRFKALAGENTEARIVIATDALGMGIDNPDIERVIQWLVPHAISNLYQRLGRAMRCGQNQAYFFWLYPSWCTGPRSGRVLQPTVAPNPPAEDTDAEQVEVEPGTKSKAKKVDPDRRRDMPDGLWSLLNGGCIREEGLKFFEDVAYKKQEWQKPDACCSKCHPEFQIEVGIPESRDKASTKRQRHPLKRPWYTQQLIQWRSEKAKALFQDQWMQLTPELIMPDQILENLALWAEYITDDSSMRENVGSGWTDMPLYSSEILSILVQGQGLGPKDQAMKEAWDLNKTGTPAEKLEVAAAKVIEDRRSSWIISRGYRDGRKKKKTRESRIVGGGSTGPSSPELSASGGPSAVRQTQSRVAALGGQSRLSTLAGQSQSLAPENRGSTELLQSQSSSGRLDETRQSSAVLESRSGSVGEGPQARSPRTPRRSDVAIASTLRTEPAASPTRTHAMSPSRVHLGRKRTRPGYQLDAREGYD